MSCKISTLQSPDNYNCWGAFCILWFREATLTTWITQDPGVLSQEQHDLYWRSWWTVGFTRKIEKPVYCRTWHGWSLASHYRWYCKKWWCWGGSQAHTNHWRHQESSTQNSCLSGHQNLSLTVWSVSMETVFRQLQFSLKLVEEGCFLAYKNWGWRILRKLKLAEDCFHRSVTRWVRPSVSQTLHVAIPSVSGLESSASSAWSMTVPSKLPQALKVQGRNPPCKLCKPVVWYHLWSMLTIWLSSARIGKNQTLQTSGRCWKPLILAYDTILQQQLRTLPHWNQEIRVWCTVPLVRKDYAGVQAVLSHRNRRYGTCWWCHN